MESPKTFVNLFLGDMNVQQWLFALLLMGMGATIYILLRIKGRKVKENKPSFAYWMNDLNNILSIPIALMLTYILIRFYSEYQDLLQNNLPEGLQVTQYFAMLVVGFYQQKIVTILSKKAMKL
jgi:hypothetical protein